MGRMKQESSALVAGAVQHYEEAAVPSKPTPHALPGFSVYSEPRFLPHNAMNSILDHTLPSETRAFQI